jgi:hypothetical protein
MADLQQNEKIDWRQVFRPAAVLLVLIGAMVGTIYLFVRIGWFTFEPLNTKDFVAQNLLYLLLAALFGAAVGAAEIISRYRDEPFIAVLSPPGLSYLLLNAIISALAFFLVIHYQGTMFPNIRDRLLASILTGFGSMVVMRSKLFSFKTEAGEVYSVGPEAVLAIFLSSVDRQIDRYRASRRQELVYEQTCDIADAINAPSFLRAFLVSYQNLSSEEKQKINADIKDIYANPDLPTPLLKFMAVAFGFLNIMGERNFKALILQLKRYQKLSASKLAHMTSMSIQPPATATGATKSLGSANLANSSSPSGQQRPISQETPQSQLQNPGTVMPATPNGPTVPSFPASADKTSTPKKET